MFTYLKRSNIFTIYINLLLVEYIYSYFRISIMTLFLLQIGILRLSFYEGKKKTYHPTSILPWHYSILAVGVNNPPVRISQKDVIEEEFYYKDSH
jgi:hypothetical protein